MAHRDRVEAHFQRVFSTGAQASGGAPDDPWSLLWAGRLQDDAAERTLTDHGFSPARESLQRLDDLRSGHAVRWMSRQGRERLDRLMPRLLSGAAATAAPGETLRRLVPLLEATARRSVYLALLLEHPELMERPVVFVGERAVIARPSERVLELLD